jgi:PAS domain S-box-containing protein
MHGYEVQELVGNSILPLDSESDKKNFPKVWEEIRNKGFWRCELLRVRKDGSFFPAIMTSTLVLDNEGKPVCVIGICVDINERKKIEDELRENRSYFQELVEERTEELTAANEKLQQEIIETKILESKLKESREKYRDLFKNASDIMYTFSAAGNFLTMNNIGLITLGHTKEEIIGSNIAGYLAPESYETGNKALNKITSGDLFEHPIVLEVLCKNGKVRLLEATERPVKTGDRVTEIHGIIRDVTENIRLKQELMKSNKKSRLLCSLIEGSRGGKTRALILRKLIDRPYNANQLANVLNMDYKTIRHHLDVFIKNEVIRIERKKGYRLYLIFC